MAGLAPRPAFLTETWLLGQFATDVDPARRRYADFITLGTPFASSDGLLAAA